MVTRDDERFSYKCVILFLPQVGPILHADNIKTFSIHYYDKK